MASPPARLTPGDRTKILGGRVTFQDYVIRREEIQRGRQVTRPITGPLCSARNDFTNWGASEILGERYTTAEEVAAYIANEFPPAPPAPLPGADGGDYAIWEIYVANGDTAYQLVGYTNPTGWSGPIDMNRSRDEWDEDSSWWGHRNTLGVVWESQDSPSKYELEFWDISSLGPGSKPIATIRWSQGNWDLGYDKRFNQVFVAANQSGGRIYTIYIYDTQTQKVRQHTHGRMYQSVDNYYVINGGVLYIMNKTASYDFWWWPTNEAEPTLLYSQPNTGGFDGYYIFEKKGDTIIGAFSKETSRAYDVLVRLRAGLAPEYVELPAGKYTNIECNFYGSSSRGVFFELDCLNEQLITQMDIFACKDSTFLNSIIKDTLTTYSYSTYYYSAQLDKDPSFAHDHLLLLERNGPGSSLTSGGYNMFEGYVENFTGVFNSNSDTTSNYSGFGTQVHTSNVNGGVTTYFGAFQSRRVGQPWTTLAYIDNSGGRFNFTQNQSIIVTANQQVSSNATEEPGEYTCAGKTFANRTGRFWWVSRYGDDHPGQTLVWFTIENLTNYGDSGTVEITNEARNGNTLSPGRSGIVNELRISGKNLFVGLFVLSGWDPVNRVGTDIGSNAIQSFLSEWAGEAPITTSETTAWSSRVNWEDLDSYNTGAGAGRTAYLALPNAYDIIYDVLNPQQDFWQEGTLHVLMSGAEGFVQQVYGGPDTSPTEALSYPDLLANSNAAAWLERDSNGFWLRTWDLTGGDSRTQVISNSEVTVTGQENTVPLTQPLSDYFAFMTVRADGSNILNYYTYDGILSGSNYSIFLNSDFSATSNLFVKADDGGANYFINGSNYTRDSNYYFTSIPFFVNNSADACIWAIDSMDDKLICWKQDGIIETFTSATDGDGFNTRYGGINDAFYWMTSDYNTSGNFLFRVFRSDGSNTETLLTDTSYQIHTVQNTDRDLGVFVYDNNNDQIVHVAYSLPNATFDTLILSNLNNEFIRTSQSYPVSFFDD